MDSQTSTMASPVDRSFVQRAVRLSIPSITLVLSYLAPGELSANGVTGNWLGPFDWDGVPASECQTATHLMALRGGGDTTIVLHMHGVGRAAPCDIASPRVVVIPPGVSSPDWSALLHRHVPPTNNLPDPFCGGHASLADGSVLFVGGTSFRTNGHKAVQIFDPRYCLVDTILVDGVGYRNGWRIVDSLSVDRWYPTVTPLPDGRMLASSGLRHFEMFSFGGRTIGGAMVPSKPDVLALPQKAFWSRYGSIGTPAYRPEPAPRSDHTLVSMPWSKLHDEDGWGSVLMFGGRLGNGPATDETWVAWQLGHDASPSWSWIQPNRVNWDPQLTARYEHSAIAFKAPTTGQRVTDIYVYGGRRQDGTLSDELWRLRFSVLSGDEPHEDNEISAELITDATGPSPGLRYGHTAVYDEREQTSGTERRMLVFGGRTTGDVLADDAVYALDVSVDPPHWSKVEDASPTNERARYRHSAIMDGPSSFGANSKPRRMIVYGGQRASGLTSSTLVLRRCNDNNTCLDSYDWDASTEQVPLPPARYQHTAVYDEEWHRMLVFGGQKSIAGDQFDREVWEMPLESFSGGSNYNTTVTWQNVAPDSLDADIEPRSGHAAIWNPRYTVESYLEIFDPTRPTGQQWSKMTQAPLYDQAAYPFYFLLPSGSVFYAGRSTRSPQPDGTANNDAETRRMTRPSSDPLQWSWSTTRYKSHVGGSSAVMFEPGRIMKFGQPLSNSSQAHPDVRTLSFGAADATSGWVAESLAPPGFRPQPRVEPNLTLLPDGNVLVSGGRDDHEDSGAPFQRPQIWSPPPVGSPATGTWTDRTTLLPDPSTRGYHSTAVLSPDGRVLSAGGNHAGAWEPGKDRLDALTVFEPSYLFQAGSTQYATRPAITAEPDTLLYGNCHTLQVSPAPASLHRLGLMRPGATTHAFNMDQYSVALTQSVGAGGLVDFRAPVDGHTAPPGQAYLIAVDNGAQRTPSVAKWVTVGPRHDLLDVTRPQAVPLTTIPNQCSNTVLVRWTETADDGNTASSGRVRLHDLRYSTSSIPDMTAFNAATQVDCEPVPRGPGAQLSKTLALPSGSYAIRHVSWDDRWPYDQSSALSGECTFTLNPSGCGGGGPFIDGEGGEGGGGLSARRAADENSAAPTGGGAQSLFDHGGDGEERTDEVRLLAPRRVAGDRIEVRLHRGAGGTTAIRRVGLTAVDRPAGVEAMRLEGAFAAVVRVPATAATMRGADVAERLAGDASYFVVGDHGDTLSVELPALPAGLASTPVYLEAASTRAPADSGAHLRMQSDGVMTPLALRASPSLVVAGQAGASPLRVTFHSNAAVHAVGRLMPTSDSVAASDLPLVLAMHNRLGASVEDSLQSGAWTELLPGDTLTLQFAESALASGAERDLWFRVTGAQYGSRSTVAERRGEATPEEPSLEFALLPAHPNPMRGSVTLPFTLARGAMTRLEVFDLQGRRVLERQGWRPAGRHEVAWDGRDASGGRIAPGVYAYRLSTGADRAQRRLVVLP